MIALLIFAVIASILTLQSIENPFGAATPVSMYCVPLLWIYSSRLYPLGKLILSPHSYCHAMQPFTVGVVSLENSASPRAIYVV